MISRRAFVRLSLFAAVAVGLMTGCANYQLGTGAKLSFTTLYVAPVQTRVVIPQAQAIVSTQVRAAFGKDTRITLVNTEGEADAVLSLTLTDYHREAAVSRANDTGLARKFVLTLGATATLKARDGHAFFTDRPLNVQRDAFTDSGQLQAEYQMLPQLADALAEKATHAVLDTW